MEKFEMMNKLTYPKIRRRKHQSLLGPPHGEHPNTSKKKKIVQALEKKHHSQEELQL